MKYLLQAVAGAALALSADLICKAWAEQALVPYQPVPIVGSFARMTLGYNTGVAFSLFINGGVLLLLVTAIVIVALGSWSLRALVRGTLPPRAVLPVGLVLGGALGNFVDRLSDGRVTDFIDIGLAAVRRPTFNTADMWIVGGIALLLLYAGVGTQDHVGAAS